MVKQKLNHIWIRILQLYVVLWWTGLIIAYAGAIARLRFMIYIYLVFAVVGIPIGFLSLFSYYKDAKYIKQNVDGSHPDWLTWTALHLLAGLLIAPVYLILRGRRFDNDWRGLVPAPIRS